VDKYAATFKNKVDYLNCRDLTEFDIESDDVLKEYTPCISIVVPVKNEEKRINATLQSLAKIDYPNYEVIIVDGGSTDDTINSAKEFPFKIIQATNSTPGQGRNIGVKNSSGEVIAFTDGDCMPEKNWLKNALSYLKCKGVGGVGGPMVANDKSNYNSKTMLDVLSTFFANAGSTNFARYKKLRAVTNIPSCNAIYRRKVLEEAGLFSDDLRFCEDVDLNHKIRKNGYRVIYSPNVVVKHNWKVDSFFSLFRFFFKYGAGRATACGKNQHLTSLLHMFPSLCLISTLFLLASSIFAAFFGLLAIIIISSYLILTVFFGFLCFLQFKDLKMIVIAPITYISTHFGYALGFISGLIFKEKAYL
jgi:glycosyltransferase involved in cell wall biosynthesis